MWGGEPLHIGNIIYWTRCWLPGYNLCGKFHLAIWLVHFLLYMSFFLSKSLKQTQLPGMYHVKEIHDQIIFLSRTLTLDRPISIPYASKNNLLSPNILDHLLSPSQWKTLFNPEPIVNDKLVSKFQSS